MKPVIQYILLLFLAGCLNAQNTDQSMTGKLDEYLEIELKKFNIPNLEILVIKGEATIYVKSIGHKSNSSTTHYLGSISKSLTALGVLKLVDKETLELDQNVIELLPNLKFCHYEQEVTIQTLLNHTSGISKMNGFSKLPSLHELQSIPYKIDINFEPGTKHEYSNLNYSILGLIIEEASGLPYEKYMRNEVFEPLNMTKTFANNSENLKNNLGDQFQYWFGYPLKSKQMGYPQTAIPAGFICSSAEDMGNYIKVNLNSGLFEKRQILSSRLLNIMHTPWDKDDYGYAMGWKQGRVNEKIFLQHLGSTATSYSGLFIIPKDTIGFIVLTNSNTLSFTEGILKGVLQIIAESEPDSVSRNELYLRIGMGIFFLFVVAKFVVNIVKGYKTPVENSTSKIFRSLALNAVFLFGTILIFPRIFEIPFGTFVRFQPDIGVTIILSLSLPIVVNIIKLLRNGNPCCVYKSVLIS